MNPPKQNDPIESTKDAYPVPSLSSETREARKIRRLSLKDLSEAAGISVSYISVVERDAGNPSKEMIEALASALKVEVDWLFAPRHGAGPMERAYIVRAD